MKNDKYSTSFNPLQVKLESFQGPLDILLQLIQKKKLDINTIPLTTLCLPFLDYVKNSVEISLENSSHFVYIASRLLAIKAKNLLPNRNTLIDEEEINPEEEWREQLLEYKKIKQSSELLTKMDWLNVDIFSRVEQIEKVELTEELKLNIPDLLESYKNLLIKEEKGEVEFTIKEFKMNSKITLNKIIAKYQSYKSFTLIQLFSLFELVEEKVLAFILLLEIYRFHWIRIEQKNYLGKIVFYTTSKFTISSAEKLIF